MDKKYEELSQFIVTFSPFFKKALINELKKITESVNIKKMFDESRTLISTELPEKTFIQNLIQIKSIFVKHIMPVHKSGDITGNLEIDKKNLLEACSDLVNLNGSEKFAVQCRIAKGIFSGIKAYSSKDIEVFLGLHYASFGNIPSFSDKNLKNEEIKVISVFICKNEYYLGFSTSAENLNFHSDEHRIFSNTGREISRAENKLKEALSKFQIGLSGKGIALDLGASPGGWTKVLADYGYDVIAVDPGDLHFSLKNNPKITHKKIRIEKLKFDNYFDIIVNDMNMNPQKTAEIMITVADSLKKDGVAIVTLKLPFSDVTRGITEASKILEEKFEILAIKSLFHNRQEVTALLRKK